MRHRPIRRALLAVPVLALSALAPVALSSPAQAAAGAPVVRTLTRATTTTFHAGATGSAAPTDHQLAPDLEGLAADGTTTHTPVANRSGASRARALRTTPPPGAPGTALPVGTTSAQVGPPINGLNILDQRTANGGNQFSLEPPDQALCVGGGHVVEAVNDVLRVFGTDGTTQPGVADLNTLLGYPMPQYDRKQKLEGPFVTDPVCLFDQPTQTFFLVTLTLDVVPTTGDFTGKNTLDVATAKDPTGTWTVYHLAVQDDGTDGTPDHGAACPCIGDYPHIGADANGFYITTNEYPFFADGFVAAQVYAFPKAALASGANTMTGVQIDTQGLDAGKPGFTVWPAISPGATDFDAGSKGTEWFLSSNAAEETGGDYHGTQVVTWALTGTSTLGRTNAVQLAHTATAVHDYYLPPLADQKAGSTPLADCLNAVDCEKLLLGKPSPYKASEGKLDAGDTRMQQVYWAGGKLYGAIDTAVDLSGSVKAGIAYYVLQPSASRRGLASNVVSQGTFGVANNNVTYPTMGVTAAGKAILSFTLAGADHYPSQAFTVLGQPTVQVTLAGLGPQDGFSEYRAFGDPPRPRWGDYGASSVVGNTIWTANEYIPQTCTYAQFVSGTLGRCADAAHPEGTRGVLGNWGTAISAITP